MVVTVAIYEFWRGEEIRVFAKYEDALAWRRQIAGQFWDQELSREPKPPDPNVRADRYFELMADADEYFRWDEYEVE